MINQTFPIKPSLILIDLWWEEARQNAKYDERIGPIVATKAAQWGANQELETILEMVGFGQQSLPEEDRYLDGFTVASIRAARRPKPPSLKEQVLDVMDTAITDGRLSSDASILVRLLVESLPND